MTLQQLVVRYVPTPFMSSTRSPKPLCPTPSEVAAFRRLAPATIPASFVRFHEETGAVSWDLAGAGSGQILFWNLAEVLELNETYGFSEFAPGLFGFGSDGGGGLFVFDLRERDLAPVGQVPAIPMDLEHFRFLANSFEKFACMLKPSTAPPTF